MTLSKWSLCQQWFDTAECFHSMISVVFQPFPVRSVMSSFSKCYCYFSENRKWWLASLCSIINRAALLPTWMFHFTPLPTLQISWLLFIFSNLANLNPHWLSSFFLSSWSWTSKPDFLHQSWLCSVLIVSESTEQRSLRFWGYKIFCTYCTGTSTL